MIIHGGPVPNQWFKPTAMPQGSCLSSQVSLWHIRGST